MELAHKAQTISQTILSSAKLAARTDGMWSVQTGLGASVHGGTPRYTRRSRRSPFSHLPLVSLSPAPSEMTSAGSPNKRPLQTALPKSRF